MKIDNYTFYSPTRTETIDGKRVKKLMAIHKVTGEIYFFSVEEIEQMRQSVHELENSAAVNS